MSPGVGIPSGIGNPSCGGGGISAADRAAGSIIINGLGAAMANAWKKGTLNFLF